MQWGVLSSIFLLGAFKFLFSAIPGVASGVPLLETYFASIAGAVLCSTVFYFGSEWIMHWSHRRKIEKIQKLISEGRAIKVRKKFTRTNRLIIRVKWKLGIYGVTFYAPMFLSIPIGTIITAKFYGKKKITYPLLILGICLNGFIVTAFWYLWE